MSEPEEVDRDEVYLAKDFRAESGHNESRRNEFAAVSPLPGNGRESMGRVVGNPLPAGNPLHGGGSAHAVQEPSIPRAAPPGRALTPVPSEDTSESRAMSLLKQAVPFVQKLLPLIDGNFGTAIANFLSPRPHANVPPANIDLTPVQNQLSELQMQHNELRGTVQEQTTGLKRVEDQLEMVREATDRNTLEQQELIEDLKAMGNKVNLFAVTLSALLLLSLVLNVILYLHIKRVLP